MPDNVSMLVQLNKLELDVDQGVFSISFELEEMQYTLELDVTDDADKLTMLEKLTLGPYRLSFEKI